MLKEMPRNTLGIILGVPTKTPRFLLVHGSRNQMSTFITARSLLLDVANLYSLPISFFEVHNKNRFLMGTRDCFSRSCVMSCSTCARGWEASPKGFGHGSICKGWKMSHKKSSNEFQTEICKSRFFHVVSRTLCQLLSITKSCNEDFPCFNNISAIFYCSL
jgi:hypothetical protein